MPSHALAARPALHRPSPARHHEVDVEPHAHPGDPRRVVVSERETDIHEGAPQARRSGRPTREPHP